MNMQYELNKELLEATTKCDLKKVEHLLSLGADPLGSSDACNPNEHILGELFDYALNDTVLAETMPQIIKLFLAYGMNIGARNILSDDGDNTNPLWTLAFCQDENGLKMLEVLLDHKLDHTSAEELVDHILVDMELFDGCEIEDPWLLERTIYALKMVMLTASYPHIIDLSSYIRECVDLENNRAENLPKFRKWDHFEYHIDKSTCTNIPHGLQDATLTIRDLNTKETVWIFKI